MSLIIFPRVSEKSYAQATDENTYVFNVPINAAKIEIKKAVKEQFSVDVLGVNIVKMLGKPKQSVKKGGRRTKGKRSDYKKAYVTVKKGQTIPVFAANQEEDK
jgi:large subunit ribosomal protein L23